MDSNAWLADMFLPREEFPHPHHHQPRSSAAPAVEGLGEPHNPREELSTNKSPFMERQQQQQRSGGESLSDLPSASAEAAPSSCPSSPPAAEEEEFMFGDAPQSPRRNGQMRINPSHHNARKQMMMALLTSARKRRTLQQQQQQQEQHEHRGKHGQSDCQAAAAQALAATPFAQRFTCWKSEWENGLESADLTLRRKLEKCRRFRERKTERMSEEIEEEEKEESMQQESGNATTMQTKKQQRTPRFHYGKVLLAETTKLWTALVREAVPPKLEELKQVSSFLLGECLCQLCTSQSLSAATTTTSLPPGSAGIRPDRQQYSARLVQAFKTFHSKASTISVVLRQLADKKEQEMVKQAYTEAFKETQPVLSTLSDSPALVDEGFDVCTRATEHLKTRFLEALRLTFVQLELIEKEADAALVHLNSLLASLREASHDQPPQQTQPQPQRETRKRPRSECDENDDEQSTLKDVNNHNGNNSTTEEPASFESQPFFRKRTWKQFLASASEGLAPVSAKYNRLEQQLKALNLRAVRAQPGPNAQFRALAHQLYHKEDNYKLLRASIADEIAANRHLYEPLISHLPPKKPTPSPSSSAREEEEEEEHMQIDLIEQYCQRVRQEQQKGDHITLQAFANLHRSNIIVYSPLFQRPLLIQSHHSSPTNAESERLATRFFHLAFLNHNYYYSLLRPSPSVEAHEDHRTSSSSAAIPQKRLKTNTPSENPARENNTTCTSHTSSICGAVDNNIANVTSVRAPRSLATLCATSIARSIHQLPSLHTKLPEELLLRLITQCVKEGTMRDTTLVQFVGPSLTSLPLSGCKLLTDACMQPVSPNLCGNLRKISFSGCNNIGNDVVVRLSRRCQALEELYLDGCFRINGQSLLALARSRSRASLRRLALDGTAVTDEAVAELTRACPQLEWMSLRGCRALGDSAFRHLGASVVYLDVSGCNITDVGLAMIAARCPNLYYFRTSSKAITDAAVETLCRSCPKISSLHFTGCDSLTDNTVETLSRHWLSLEALTLSACKMITNDAFSKLYPFPTPQQPASSLSSTSSPFSFLLPKTTTNQLVQKSAFLTIESLDLSRCVNLEDSGVRSLAYSCPNLRVLNLSSCEEITDEGVIHLARCCPRLRKVDFSKCRNLGDAAIIEIARCSKQNLKKVGLYNCINITDEAVAALAQHCPRLRSLDLASCEKITDKTLLYLSSYPNNNSDGNYQLQDNKASGTAALRLLSLEECQQLSESALMSFFEKGCPALRTLKLAYCQRVTDRVLQKMAEGCPKLECVDLSYCNNIKSLQSIRWALRQWPSLLSLGLRGYNHISAAALSHPALQVLNLSWCKNLQDAALLELAAGCPRLEQLNLAWCSNLSGKHLHDLPLACPHLKLLNLRGCFRVSFVCMKSLSVGQSMTVYR
ncbi:hypothetical protein QOT17_002390 [Balamuthia mandrillaris]